MTEKKDWLHRAATVARQAELVLLEANPTLVPERDSSGLGIGHALYMARELQRGGLEGAQIDSETKACRWLGWMQCILAYHNLSTLDDSKNANLNSGVQS